MLVLTRGEGEAIVLAIGREVIARIVVVGFKGAEARLGFDAPSTVVIDREEVWKHRAAGQTITDRDARRKARIDKLRAKADELERNASA